MQNARSGKSRYVNIGIAVLAMLGTMFALTATGVAQTENVLYSFTGGNDGSSPQSNLIFDGAGNLYGTATFGGPPNTRYCGGNGCGVIFELSPNGSGGWNYKVLHAFTGATDGATPSAGLTLYDGNLYGTAFGGGTSANCEGGCGVVFKLSPNGSGGWKYAMIHSFDGTRGSNPSGVVLDGDGNIYGTAAFGGTDTYGVLYKLTPTVAGGWDETVLHDFTIGADGGQPNALIIDASSSMLYGTTYLGGTRGECLSYGCGIVFKFSLTAHAFHLIYSFQGKADGGNASGLALDESGNLYVAAGYGGNHHCKNYGCGTIFELAPSGSGWIKDAIYAFKGGSDGEFPFAGPTLDGSGNLYGTTNSGGSGGAGVVYELSFSGGLWNETLLTNFNNGTVGGYPNSGVTLDGLGNIYGQTSSGGIPGDCSDLLGCGVVYEVTP